LLGSLRYDFYLFFSSADKLVCKVKVKLGQVSFQCLD